MKNQYKEQPESDPLAKKWGERVTSARRHWERFHKRIRHNRQLVAGFDWSRDPTESNFYMHRANLIHSTIMSILPSIYARNPEISVTPQHADRGLKLLCKTLETVTNSQLVDAHLKKRAKATVRAALTCSFGVLKVMYQRDIGQDPLIQSRIQDAQDNLARVDALLLELNDESRAEEERVKAELEETLASLMEKAEVVTAEGLVIDRVLTEHILIDPSVAEFWDYEQADWMMQIVPMKKSLAEGLYGYKLDKATMYHHPSERNDSNKLFSGTTQTSDEAQICILEIWDKQSQRVYTLAEGCDYWLRDPYSPEIVGERWYPFFLLPFNTVDGQFIGPSIVDLTERLQEEHNRARDRFNEHRDLIKPGYIASADVNERTIKRFADAELGEITLIDAEGKPIQQAIMPKSYPPIDPMVYDTTSVRYDWEQVTGLQDAARSSVMTPKTATEAMIMQKSLSGRVAEFRDQVEDYLQEIAQYAAQILIQEMTPEQVERIMGPHKKGNIPGVLDPMTGNPVEGIIEAAYDWPALSRDAVFDLVQLQIRAGTTGGPDTLDQQETWIKLMPVIQPLIMQIMQMQLQGVDTTALIALLKETVTRFDEKLDVDAFIPNLKPPAPDAAQQGGQSTGQAPQGEQAPQGDMQQLLQQVMMQKNMQGEESQEQPAAMEALGQESTHEIDQEAKDVQAENRLIQQLPLSGQFGAMEQQ